MPNIDDKSCLTNQSKLTERTQIRDMLSLVHGVDPTKIARAPGQNIPDFLSEVVADDEKFVGERVTNEQFSRMQKIVDEQYGYKEIPVSLHEAKMNQFVKHRSRI